MTDEARQQKKEIIVQYLSKLPIYKWAAKSAGIDEDTLKNWRDIDSNFSGRCEAARSEAVEKLGNKATPEFILTATDPETFGKHEEAKVEGNYNININGLIGLSQTPAQTTNSDPTLTKPQD
jgi:hypothetical protein